MRESPAKMKIIITVGHSRLKNGRYTSADGRGYGGCNEYIWCKRFSRQLQKALEKKGHKVKRVVCPEKKFIRSTEEKDYKLNIINSGDYDLAIELHLNAAEPDAEGCEVLYKSDKDRKYAVKVQTALSQVFTDRGIKQRDDLYILNSTNIQAILIETFFCTSKGDYEKAKGLTKRKRLAKMIADEISM